MESETEANTDPDEHTSNNDDNHEPHSDVADISSDDGSGFDAFPRAMCTGAPQLKIELATEYLETH